MSTYFNESWPTTINTDNVRWESVKTEGEEYLDKLQSKLKRVMSHAAQGSLPNSNSGSSNTKNNGAHRDVLGMNEGDTPIDAEPVDSEDGDDHILPPVDDEGLHLLYNREQDKDMFAAEDRDEQSTAVVLEQDDGVNAEDEELEYQQIPADTSQTQATETSIRPRLVRFRSRVRIGSGIRNISTSSSACESASSSISVPLRGSRPSDSRPALTGHPTASLTEMLTTDATNAWLNGLSAVRRAKRQQTGKPPPRPSLPRRQSSDSSISTERTALLARVYSYTEPTENEFDNELDRIQAAARKTEEEVMFGKWPWRLFNRYWWWWKIEPIVCCCERFEDESDSDT